MTARRVTFESDGSDLDLIGHERPYIPFERVVKAAQLIDRSGAVERVAQCRAIEREGKGPGGRPAYVDDRAILTLFMLLALEHSAMHLTLAQYIVTDRLRDDSLRYLQLNMGDASDQKVYNRLSAAMQRFVKPIDPYRTPKRKRLTYEEWEQVLDGRVPEDVLEREAHLHDVANGLVLTSVEETPAHIAARFTGDYAIDGTFIRCGGSRGTDNFNKKYVSSEPDGGRYYREGNHGGTDLTTAQLRAVKLKKKSTNSWGNELHPAVMVKKRRDDPLTFPLLIAGVAFDRPSGRPGQNAVAVFKSISDSGLGTGHVIADRAYWAGATVENFHVGMAAMGYLPVTDYKDEQLGAMPGVKGMLQVEGQWYCSEMPQNLVDASKDFRAGLIDDGLYAARIEARKDFQAIRKSRPNKHGTSRWAHPELDRSECDPSRPHAPKFCTQKSVSVPLEVGLKLAQEYPYMSREWRDRYATRNTAESVNASLKRSSTHGLADPERRRLRGRASKFILTSLAVMAHNIMTIRTFMKASRNGEEPVEVKPRPKRAFGHSTQDDDIRAKVEASQHK